MALLGIVGSEAATDGDNVPVIPEGAAVAEDNGQ